MANSKVQIYFGGPIYVDQELIIKDAASFINLSEVFKTIRAANGQSTIGSNEYISANNFYQALTIDYQSSGLYTFSIINNTVTIQATTISSIFTVISNTTSTVVPTITNTTDIAPIKIVEAKPVKNSTNPCGSVDYNITTSILATQYSLDGVNFIPNTDNPFTFSYIRGSAFNLYVKDISNNTVSTPIITPSTWNLDEAYFKVFSTPTGSTITIGFLTPNGNAGLTFEYSLDGATWQASNVFSGLYTGFYTFYVRDQFGCLNSTGYNLEVFEPGVNVKNSFSYISNNMSIRFKHNQEWNDFNIFKNDSNTLACEESVTNAYGYIQKFRPTDILTTQLLSNYEEIEANVIKADGTKDVLEVTKEINFLDIEDRRDCNIYNLGNGKTGIYFLTGNTYDYDTAAPIGTYALNGALPNYGSINNYIKIAEEGWWKIVDIIYNEDVNADVLVTQRPFSGSPSVVQISANYNQKNYNVYEFKIDCAVYDGQVFQVEVLQHLDGFTDTNYLSEKIEVGLLGNEYVELIWWNDTDSYVYYSTGIKSKSNYEILTFASSNDSNIEINKTPSTSILIQATNYNTKELVVDGLSTAIMVQFIQAVLHKELYLNKVQYISQSTPESEVIDFTNQYTVTASLIKTGEVYNAEYVTGDQVETTVEVPGLLQNTINYIKLN